MTIIETLHKDFKNKNFYTIEELLRILKFLAIIGLHKSSNKRDIEKYQKIIFSSSNWILDDHQEIEE